MSARLLAGMVTLGIVSTLTAIGCGSEGSDFDDPLDNSSGGASSSGAPGSSGFIGGGGGGASSGGGGQRPACATAESGAERQPVYLDIILDGSGSMDAELYPVAESGTPPQGWFRANQCAPNTYRRVGTTGGVGAYGICRDVNYSENDPASPGRYTGRKWIAARDALKAFFDTQAQVASPNLGVGLFVFSSTHLQTQTPNSRPVGLLDPTHANSLWGLIAPPVFPLGRTPIRASIDSQAASLRAFDGQEPLLADGRRVILLITDGVPVANDGGPVETIDTVKAAVQAARDGTPAVETAVIGVGDPLEDESRFNETFLSELAYLGGVAPAGCKQSWSAGDSEPSCHLQVTPGEKTAQQIQQDLINAINAIAGAVASCSLTLNQSAAIDPGSVNVVFIEGDGTESQIPKDSTNGWSYDNPEQPTRVILHGQACKDLQGDEDSRVSIVVGCPTGTEVR